MNKPIINLKKDQKNPLKKNKTIIRLIILLILYVITITSSTYAFLIVSSENGVATGEGGCFEVSYTGQDLNAGNILTTVNYQEGAHTTVTLSKDASCKIYTEANIFLHTNETTTAPIASTPALRYKVFNGSTEIADGLVSNLEDHLLVKVPLTDSPVTYTIYVWIDSDLSDGKYHATTYSGYIYAESAQTSTVENSYLVTFDANGGNKPNSMVVTYNQPYGNLPTPTKAGYTFNGWNGKNLINLDVPQSTPSDLTGANTTKREFTTNTYVKGLAYNNYYSTTSVNSLTVSSNSIQLTARSGYGVAFPLLSSSNKSYTLSFDSNGTTNRGYSLLYYKKDGSLISYSQSGMASNHITKTFTTPNNTYYLVIEFYGSSANENIVLSNIQLEEGTTATTYEPYYITSSSTVTQQANHTLYAIWTPKTYTVTFNADGGSVSPSTMQVTYNNSYGTLPTPTRSGYTFKGWNGKNILNLSEYISNSQNYIVTSNSIRIIKTNENTNYTSNKILNQMNSNTTYTISADIDGSFDGRIYAFFGGSLTKNNINEKNKIVKTFTYSSTDDKGRLVIFQNSTNTSVNMNLISNEVLISNIQLEEGSTATTYEPFYIKGTTPVTQAKNHTLTAIWEQN